MKEISTPLKEHLTGETTTLCNCWKLKRLDGVVMGFTDHDRDISFDGVKYESASGFEAGEVEEVGGITPDTAAVMGALSSDAITEADIASGRYDGATIEVWLVNWHDPKARLLQSRLELGELERSGAHFKADLRGLSARLDETTGRRFVRKCDAELGDKRCGVDISASKYSREVSVTGVMSPSLISLEDMDILNVDALANGRLKWLSGENAGNTAIINGHLSTSTGTALQLWLPPYLPIAVGDRCQVVVGCDKQFATCRDFFSNSANFRGFPHVPGNDFATGYAANFNRHDGGPLVP